MAQYRRIHGDTSHLVRPAQGRDARQLLPGPVCQQVRALLRASKPLGAAIRGAEEGWGAREDACVGVPGLVKGPEGVSRVVCVLSRLVEELQGAVPAPLVRSTLQEHVASALPPPAEGAGLLRQLRDVFEGGRELARALQKDMVAVRPLVSCNTAHARRLPHLRWGWNHPVHGGALAATAALRQRLSCGGEECLQSSVCTTCLMCVMHHCGCRMAPSAPPHAAAADAVSRHRYDRRVVSRIVNQRAVYTGEGDAGADPPQVPAFKPVPDSSRLHGGAEPRSLKRVPLAAIASRAAGEEQQQKHLVWRHEEETPPSRGLLAYLQHVCALKLQGDGSTERAGHLDASALIALGTLVEEACSDMMDRLLKRMDERGRLGGLRDFEPGDADETLPPHLPQGKEAKEAALDTILETIYG
jgi:hypothetical protein